MFDIGAGEIGLIAVVALLVLGPERLPGAARTVGALLRKARQSWQNVRSEVERELAAEDLRNTIRRNAAQAKTSAENFNTALRDMVHGDSAQEAGADPPTQEPPSRQ